MEILKKKKWNQERKINDLYTHWPSDKKFSPEKKLADGQKVDARIIERKKP